MINNTPEIVECLGALFTMEYYKERWHEEEVSDAEYDNAVTILTEASDDVWNALSTVIEDEPDSYVSKNKHTYREYCKSINMLRELS
jgi:hypothetical protein